MLSFLSLLFVPAVLGSRFSNYYAGENQLSYASSVSMNSLALQVVAISQHVWDGGSHCGKEVSLSWQGKTTTAKVVDECMECPPDALDFSQGLFEFFGGKGNNLQIGYLYGDWHYIDGNAGGNKPNDDGGDKKPDDNGDKGKETTTKEAPPPPKTTTTTKSVIKPTTTSKPASKTTSPTSATHSSASQTSSAAATTPAGPQNLQTFNQAFLNLSGLIAAAPLAAA
ncbi:hypothetical protein C8J57DRAFT_1557343 [Mycena rebaudengoi]|nr:hypothetical protein C8J57DRAFT_1557343 [Mycena rebaudengoi]